MNKDQTNYALARVTKLLADKRVVLTEKLSRPAKSISAIQRASLIRAGKVRMRASCTSIDSYTDVVNAFDFSEYEWPKAVDSKALAKALAPLEREAQRIKDTLMLGDASEALSAIEKFASCARCKLTVPAGGPRAALLEYPAQWVGLVRLAGKLKAADAAECAAMGYKPVGALTLALSECQEGTFMVLSDDSREVVGAYGYNHRGNIWSLWAPLTIREAKCMLANSEATIQSVLQRSGQSVLSNFVWTENHAALKWMSRCPSIQIDRTTTKRYGNLQFYPFKATRTS